MRKLMLSAICLLFALAGKAEGVSSPSGQVKLDFELSKNGAPTYQVEYKGKSVIKPSTLGLELKNANNLLDGFEVLKASTSTFDEIWQPVWGETKDIRNHYNELLVELKQPATDRYMNLRFRVYDDGVGFRYEFPQQKNLVYFVIKDEHTQFAMTGDHTAWWIPGDYDTQEYDYTESKLSEIRGLMQGAITDNASQNQFSPTGVQTSLQMKTADGIYLNLHEAALVDYSCMHLNLDDKNLIFESWLTPDAQGDKGYMQSPCHTPWRTVIVSDDAREMLASNLILNLNDPCKYEDTSWIKPGKVMREVTLTTEGGKALVDFAVKRNLQYIHFDAGWYGFEYDKASDATTVTLDPRRNPKIDALNLKEVVAYAKQHGIGVMLYVNQRALQQQLDEILPLYKSWGISGIKFGFVQVGSQVWTKWMHEAVKKCADYGLMVDIHDEYRPTGFSRTYPNLMTQEGIRGNEEFPDATHNVTLPFTRFVAGAADYTICYYRQDFGRLNVEKDNYGVPRSKSIQTTPAHQLALAAVYYSPLQYMYWYDKPSDSQDEPELKFFDDVYTTWDDTKVLQGEVGEFITVARRRGEEWFIGSITNNEARTLPVDLSFLPAGKDYVAEIYTDGDKSIPTRTKVRVSKFRVNAKTVLHFNLRASGGSAIRLVPEVTKDKSLKTYKQQKL